MSRPTSQTSRPLLSSRIRSQKTIGKLKSFRPLPYHIALSQAARLEAWTQDVEDVGILLEAVDSSDFDPSLMERDISQT